MAAKLCTCFVCWNLTGLNCKQSSVHFPIHSQRLLLPTSCKMRQRNLSSQHKRQQIKKASNEQPSLDGDLHSKEDEDSELAISNLSKDHTVTENLNSLTISAETNWPSLDRDLHPKEDKDSEPGKVSLHDIPNLNKEIPGSTDIDNSDHMDHTNAKDLTALTLSIERTPLVMKIDGAQQTEQLSSGQVQDLLGLIKNAEKNIILLNQARVRALEDLEKILAEKEALQGEINLLEMRLAETDACIKVAAQEKIHVELLEDQLEKLRDELTHKGSTERRGTKLHESENGVLADQYTTSHDDSIHYLTEELNSLRAENASLKHAIESFKTELNSVKNTDERLVVLEKERSSLESALKDLESKLSDSQEDVPKLSTLRGECQDLCDKVENLHFLLDKATKQADQAVIVLRENQDLRRKVDEMEESLKEANVYKLSSDKLQSYNESMQQKIKLLEERLQRSDEEINSYVQLYQESVKEFQDTLNTLKEESKKRALDEPVEDMPWEFWSQLLLIIDGWLLEKKIPSNDANLLREMVWKRDGRICDAYTTTKEKSEHEAILAFRKLISLETSPGLYVIHIAVEMAPVAKVGGLGDVVSGLGKALQKKGNLVEIVLPKYDCMQYDRIHDLRALDVIIESYFDGQIFKNKIWVGTVEGLPVYFIEPLHPGKFFWRGKFYGEHDDFKRFSFFSRAALEFLLRAGKKPDIIHCHDWQTAFVAPLYWDLYASKGLNSARICFTCHNFEYQGTAPASELASCGLDVLHLNKPDRMQDNSSHDRVNVVKGAVVFSNIVTTVSPTYAQEVRTPEGGHGLHSTLSVHSKKFIGILNGIDTDAWNPATDPFLKVQYSAKDLEGKTENKEATRRKLGLSSADIRRPMVGCITRLVPQKGVHLIRHAIYRTLQLGGQFVLLGSSPIPHIQKEFEDIANHFQNHDHIRLILKYDESLSHAIYAASDMFIIPSIFEPCGLTQMISMRYGAIPIARKTGGLNDSVFDVDDDTIPSQFRNGFTFLNADEQGINDTLERAFNLYEKNPESWRQLVQKDMNIDFSWESSASQYEELYSKAVARARAAKRS
ncbi:hypothetical protein L6164_035451 [Bauhinia variegata]|uniref:Uncharacterized protein n=1 Tax=Bauhinia variegata TaxID=167791 RepID=A0ACB9KDZ9_BAUVA|nr:hypothetical protein L6164_035451 [Bauhinia variegata]